MKKSLFFTISIFLLISGYSQSDSMKVFKWGIHFEMINMECNLSNLNKTLNAAGISEIDNRFLGISLGTNSRRLNKKTYSTGNFTWLFSNSPTKPNDSINARINIYEFSTGMNWVLSKSEKWLLYPYYGFGISISKMKITKNISFNQSNSDLSSQADYKNEFPLFFIDAGLGVDRKIMIQKMDAFIGLNIGYRLSTRSGWGYTNSPATNYSGFEIKARVRTDFDCLKRFNR